MFYKIEIIKAKNGQYYWHLKAFNGQIICSSHETFVSKNYARASVEKAKWGMAFAQIVDVSN